MTTKTGDDLFRAKRGVAALVTCLVQTLNESDPSFQERFLHRLQKAYYEIQDNWEGNTIEELELLLWTGDFLTGFSGARGEPFLED